MPGRRQGQAIAQRVNEIPDERAQRRREAALRGAQTRRQRREQREAEAHPQVEAERPTQGSVARNQAHGRPAGRQPRAHRDMLTVAVRGPIAERMRAMAERHEMSLAKLLGDMVLVYEREAAGGYEVGTCLEGWLAQPD